MSLSQYKVSLASLYAIVSFEMKSRLEDAPIDSSTFAPMEVPDLSNCMDMTFSLCLLNSRDSSTTFTANENDLS